MNGSQNNPLTASILLFLMAVGIFLVFLGFAFEPENHTARDDASRFEIVSKYKNCDVVQYAPRGKSTYVYFLHCSTQ